MKLGWEVKKLRDVCKLTNGYAFQSKEYTDDGYFVVRIGNVQDGYIELNNPRYIKLSEEKQKKFILSEGDILVSLTGNVGRVGVIKEKHLPAVLNQRVARISLNCKSLQKAYLFYFLTSEYFISELIKAGRGAAQQNISTTDIENLIIPLPPLPEQQRIVAILDDAFAKIEKAKANTEQNLKNAKELFESLLWDHISGRRYLSNTSDESAENLYKKMLVARKQLINDGILPNKNDKHQDPIKENKFNIPDNWRWCYLSDISIIQEGPGIRKHQYTKDGVQFLTVTNILEGRVDLKKVEKFVSTNDFKKYKHFTINPGDIVTACSGGSWGKSAIFDSDVKIILNTSTLRLRYLNDLSLNKHLYYLTKTQFFKNQLSKHSTGQQPNYGYFHYSQIEIPLPPLEIQISIVKGLDVLEEKYNELLNNYERELNNLEELKKSLLKKAFKGEL